VTFPPSAEHVDFKLNVQRNSMFRKIGPSYSNRSLLYFLTGNITKLLRSISRSIISSPNHAPSGTSYFFDLPYNIPVGLLPATRNETRKEMRLEVLIPT
jgi:hypothetical protein